MDNMNKTIDDSYETIGEPTVQVNTATVGVVSYSAYSAPPPYDPAANGYYNQYNNQQTYGIPQPYGVGNQSVVVISQPIPIKQSFGCHYFWSCFTFWFCGIVFGGIAFILAATGSSRASQCDTAGARKFGYASVTFIIIGLVVGCVAWGIIIWWLVVDVFDCNWSIYGYCYKYRYCYYSSSYCYNNFYNSIYYYDCCYYNY